MHFELGFSNYALRLPHTYAAPVLAPTDISAPLPPPQLYKRYEDSIPAVPVMEAEEKEADSDDEDD